jgi:hypothetical protein
MRRELHVRFCEGGGVRLPSATRPILCFQHKEDAEKVLQVLPKRFEKYGLLVRLRLPKLRKNDDGPSWFHVSTAMNQTDAAISRCRPLIPLLATINVSKASSASWAQMPIEKRF